MSDEKHEVDQTPPPGFEPQGELSDGQNGGITERDGATVDEVESAVNDVNPDDGDAADGDDEAEDDED